MVDKRLQNIAASLQKKKQTWLCLYGKINERTSAQKENSRGKFRYPVLNERRILWLFYP